MLPGDSAALCKARSRGRRVRLGRLIVPEWSAPVPLGDDGGITEDAAPIELEPAHVDETDEQLVPEVRIGVDSIPVVTLRHDLIPHELSPARFFAI
jgi:hypothetical protein